MPYTIEINNTIKELKELRENETLVPFLGAGFSASIPGYPTWDKFVYNLNTVLKKDCSLDIDLASVFNDNWMEATEFFYYQKGKINNSDNKDIYLIGKNEFVKVITTFFESIKDDNDDSWLQHEIIVEKFNTIFTTNWDSTIEKAAIRKKIGGTRILADINCTKKFYEEKFYNNGSNNLKIYYYHGTYRCEDNSINSVVASEKDYYSRLKYLGRNPLDKELGTILSKGNLLFIGYSLSDINVAYFLNQINQLEINQPETNQPEIKNKKRPKAYFILLKTPEEINFEKSLFYKDYKEMVKIPILIKEEVDSMKLLLTNIKVNDLEPYSDRTGKLFCELCNNNFITHKGATSRFIEFLNFDSLANIKADKKKSFHDYLININNQNENIKRNFYQKSLINFINKL